MEPCGKQMNNEEFARMSSIFIKVIFASASVILTANASYAQDEPDEIIEEDIKEEDSVFLLWPPRIGGEIFIESFNDVIISSQDPESEPIDTSTSVDLNVDMVVAEPVFFNLTVSLDNFTDLGPEEDHYFGVEGLFVDDLNVNWEEERWSLIGGKFSPNFSIAYYAAPGVYGSDFAASDIEVSGRIGLGGSVTFISDERFGTHALSASVFFADTSVLSNLLGPSRDRLRRSDGGPSNTGSPKSFAIAVDGADIAALPGFRYHIGFMRQAVNRINDIGEDISDLTDETDEPVPDAGNGEEDNDVDEPVPPAEDEDIGDGEDDEDVGGGEDDEDVGGGENDEDIGGGEDDEDEPLLVANREGVEGDDGMQAGSFDVGSLLNVATGMDNDTSNFLPSDEIGVEYRFVIAGEWTMHINDDFTVTPLVEYVHFWNADGILDESRDYLTVSALLEYRNWNFAASYTGRFVKESDGTRTTATHLQISAGYTFDFGLGVGIGYRLFDEDNIMSHTAGVLLYYDYSFAL